MARVTIDVDDQVALLTLDRPEARNALNATMLTQLGEAMASVEANADVAVVVLTGVDPAFCTGLDMKEIASSRLELVPGAGRPWPVLSKPLVGAVNGAAVTGGLELALACDFLIASDRAVFADTHTRVGVVPFWGLSVMLPQAVGVRRAREMSFTGAFVDAEEAFRIGLVNRVVAHDDLLAVALGIAGEIAVADRAATSALVGLYRGFEESGDRAAVERQVAATFLDENFTPATFEQRRKNLMVRNREGGTS